LKLLSTRSKLANHNKRPEGGVALLYHFTSLKILGFHTREKPLFVSEVIILDKPYDGVSVDEASKLFTT
jgi:hypothetical protein